MAEFPARRARSSALRQIWNEPSSTSSDSESSDCDNDNKNDQSENDDELINIQTVHVAVGDGIQTDSTSKSEEDNDVLVDKNRDRWQLLPKDTDTRERRTQANVIRQTAGPTIRPGAH